MQQLVSYWKDFHEILVFFENLSRTSKFDQNRQKHRVIYLKNNAHFLQYLAEFVVNSEMFQTNL